MKIYDISLALSEQTITYSNNPEIFVEPYRTIPKYPTNLSKITFGSHTGTHVDAPRHVDNNAIGVDKTDLKKCIGPCVVLDLTDVHGKITRADLERAGSSFQLSSTESWKGKRILAKTKNSLRGFGQFYEDSIYLDGDAADWLAEKGILLFGIDWLSIKKRASEDMRPHTSLLGKNIVIFEGLDLSKVEAGEYQFIGLPLKFTDLDGAPARVVLIRN